MEKSKRYGHLSQFERDRIQALLDSGVEQQEIALVIGRDPGTISREIARNSRQRREKGRTIRGVYEAGVADHKAYVKRRYAKWQRKKIDGDSKLKEYIEGEMMNYQSPDGISGKMRRENQPFYASKTAIYEWLYSARGQWLCPFLYSRQWRPKRHRDKKTERAMIPNRRGMEERPKIVDDYGRYGDWEGDTLGRAKSVPDADNLGVVYERRALSLNSTFE